MCLRLSIIWDVTRTPRAPRFGIFVPQINTEVPALVAAARDAEKAGFDSFWVMDHLFAPGGGQADALESWLLLTAVATGTSRIRLGHLVGCNPLRHPAVLAKQAATLDVISNGRLELGLGWGSIEAELDMFGIPYGSRRERSEQLGETIEILRLMFAGEPFTYAGKHFSLTNAWGRPVPVQDRVPVHIGGAGRQLTMPLVAQHADWWNCVTDARDRLDELMPLAAPARISAQYPIGLVHPGEDRDEVVAKVERRMPRSGWGEPVIGTPDELRAHFAAEWERGVELFVARFHDKTRPETLDLFGREVIAPLSAASRG